MNALAEPLRLETTRVLRNGRRYFAPESKRRLVEACLQPGVSVASMALQHGVNANLLRKWVVDRERQDRRDPATVRAPTSSSFIPVIDASPTVIVSDGPDAVAAGDAEGPSTACLTASMPNGVTLTLEGNDARLLSAIVEALGRCHVQTGR